MESNLSFFSLPFIDNTDVDLSLFKGERDELHPTLRSLLGTDDVLAQFLSGDELLEEPDLNGPTTLHCEICRKKFDNAKKYYGHLRVHSKDNLWICDKCPNQKFSTKQQLMKHSLTHKPLERVWRCPQCDMSFEALWRLQQHMFSKHLDYRPHKCDMCDMSFHKLSDLKKHKDIHDDIKKHACKLCKARFNDASNLNRHMLSHGNEKPYPCIGCGNRFKQLASMKRHSKNCIKSLIKQETDPTDKSIRKNYCRVCGMTFQYKSALLEHCVRQHSNNPLNKIKENNSNELHMDIIPKTNVNTTTLTDMKPTIKTIANSTNTSHIETTTNNVSPDSNLGNIIASRNLNVDPNNIVNITNNPMNLHINPVNINTNPKSIPVSIQTNISFNVQTNTNTATNIPIIHANLPLNMHTNNTNLNLNPVHIDHNRTVDNIVDDILSAEDDYLNRGHISNQMINYNPPDTENHDNLINQIELLKEMNHMHILDDELLCHDLDFDSFQTMCNTNDMDYSDKNELLFDINDGRSMDQDIMNALYQNKGDHLPDLLNEPEILINTTEKVNDFLGNPAVAVNECATIFESDVDLEASTSLAANLNQLIGENSVQYISTEHDDTFIISLNSEIDAEQLTDMLNIGVSTAEDSNKIKESIKEERENTEVTAQPLVLKIENFTENSISTSSNQKMTQPISVKIEPLVKTENEAPDVHKEPRKVVKTKKRTFYVCRKCNKIFKKKDNYKAHRATHEPSLRNHICRVCGERFSYRSTLNKHTKKLHTPAVAPAHQCQRCDRSYQAAWMLKRHIARDHDFALPFKCKEKDCGRRFYKQSDLDFHNRFHKNERPYKCEVCNRGFNMLSHLNRHVRTVDCTKQVKIEELPKNISSNNIPLGKLLIINS